MSRQLSVVASPEADAAGAVAQVIASLPVSLRPGTGAADLAAVSGANWAQDASAAAAGGAAGIMIVNPAATDAGRLDADMSGIEVPVVVDSTWSHNPAVAAAAPHFAALRERGEPAAFESRVDVPVRSDLEQVLLAQLALVRAAVEPVASLTVDRWNEQGYDIRATLAGGASIALAAVLTNGLPTSASLRALSRHNAVRLHLPDPATATCGTVTVSGPDGATVLPTLWETPHRSAWRELHRRVTDGESTSELDELVADIATLRTAR